MNKMKVHIRTAINLWLMPFLIGGALAIGYEITHKTLLKLENKSKHSQKFLKKEIGLTTKGKLSQTITFLTQWQIITSFNAS